MAIIKVSDCKGVKFLSCFQTLSEVEYASEEDELEELSEPELKNPFE